MVNKAPLHVMYGCGDETCATSVKCTVLCDTLCIVQSALIVNVARWLWCKFTGVMSGGFSDVTKEARYGWWGRKSP